MKIPENWSHQENRLVRTFTFSNFVEAVSFVNAIVPLAEAAAHHPDIEVFGYKNVRVKLSTHDAGNIVTDKDIDLAKKIDQLFPGSEE